MQGKWLWRALRKLEEEAAHLARDNPQAAAALVSQADESTRLAPRTDMGVQGGRLGRAWCFSYLIPIGSGNSGSIFFVAAPGQSSGGGIAAADGYRRIQSLSSQQARAVRLFIDTNVVLDVLAQREPWFDDSARLLAHIKQGSASGHIARTHPHHPCMTCWPSI